MSVESGRLKGNLVIVDDNETTRAMLRGILRPEGIDVVGEANDGPSGVAMVLRMRPDLVCMDVNMPNSSGIDALVAIKQACPEVKVLMVSGSAERDVVQAAIKGGANGYVVKPFNAAKVIAAVRQSLSSPAAPAAPAPPVAAAEAPPSSEAPVSEAPAAPSA